MSHSGPRALTVVVWMLVAAILLIGAYKLMHPGRRSKDQQILIDKSK